MKSKITDNLKKVYFFKLLIACISDMIILYISHLLLVTKLNILIIMRYLPYETSNYNY